MIGNLCPHDIVSISRKNFKNSNFNHCIYRGIVILMADEKMNPSIGREMVKGAPDPINSAFHLTYNMVLNLLRVEEVNPEFMMERSFHQFQNYTNLPKMYEKVNK